MLCVLASAADDAAVADRIAQTKTKLKSNDAAVRKAAIESLIHSDLSDKMLPEMRETLGDRDGEVRSVAATAIGNLGAPARDAVPQLIAQLKNDKIKEARETAARALGRIGKAVPEEQRPIEPLQAAAKDDADSVTRVVALGALAMMNVELDQQVVAIRKFLHHDDALTRMKASHALGGIGLPAKAASAEIVEVLKQETDGHRRGYVARALGNVGDPGALPVLLAALEKESDAAAQGEMRGAIQKLGGKLPEMK
jgi:HEAT repeat protein